MGRLDSRTIIITGAAQGIGATFARAAAAEGGRVVACDILPLDETVASIRAHGGEAIGCTCDITRAESVAAVVARAEADFGGVQGLVNNAALFAKLAKRPFEEIPSDEFERVMTVNVRGPFEFAKAVSPTMRRQGYGKIVNIASGTVFKGQVQLLSYIASKGAVVAMTRCLARELGPAGISVNALAPGLTMSEGVKSQAGWVTDGEATIASRALRREQTPDDLIGALIFLLSGESDFMTGQTMVVDGGSVMR